VEGMWMMMQHETPEDFVLATGITTSVREFVRRSFYELGIEIEFKGEGIEEVGYVTKCNNPAFQISIGQEVVGIDKYYFRPTEVDLLIGDATKAETLLGWKPKYNLDMLISEMIQAEIVNESK
jgi:GDPmannose 4,6-dehydratase